MQANTFLLAALGLALHMEGSTGRQGSVSFSRGGYLDPGNILEINWGLRACPHSHCPEAEVSPLKHTQPPNTQAHITRGTTKTLFAFGTGAGLRSFSTRNKILLLIRIIIASASSVLLA